MMNQIQYNSGAIDAGGCVSSAWDLVKSDYGIYLGIALVAMILAGCIPCVSLFLVGPITGGVYFVVLRGMRGEPIEFGMLFRGFDKFVPLMVIGIIQSIPEIIGQGLRFSANIGEGVLDGLNRGGRDYYQSSSDPFPIAIAGGVLVVVIIVAVVLILFGVVWRIILFFAIPLAMEHNLGAIDAMKLSARAAMSNIGGLILLIILQGLIGLLGFIMLCVGIFFVLPIIYAASAFAYRQVFPMMFQPPMQNAPPPPDAYGNFGRV